MTLEILVGMIVVAVALVGVLKIWEVVVGDTAKRNFVYDENDSKE